MTGKRRRILLIVGAVVVVGVGVLVAHRVLEEEAPGIPHTVEGRDDCLACHARPTGVKPFPEDHAGRANSSCRGPHRPAEQP
jgi:hypothetical protein